MCIIIDANKTGDFLKKNKDMAPIYRWIEQKKGKIVYSEHPQIWGEIKQHEGMRKFFSERKRSGSNEVKSISRQTVDQTLPKIKVIAQQKKHQLKSNDSDRFLLALAKASGAKLLCSSDQRLHKDFKAVIDKGAVYQNQGHESLLNKFICP